MLLLLIEKMALALVSVGVSIPLGLWIRNRFLKKGG
jgi:hypothetical protein